MQKQTTKLLKLGIALPFISFLIGWYAPVFVLIFSIAGLVIGFVDRNKNRRLAWITMGINAAFIILFLFMYYSLKQQTITSV